MSSSRQSIVGLLITCGSCAPLWLAPAAGAQELVMSVHYAGVDAYCADPRDAGLLRAMKGMPEGISSLLSDIPDVPEQVETIVPILLGAVNGPFNMVMTYDDGNVAGGAWGYGLVIEMDVENAKAGREIDSLIKEAVSEANPNLKIKPSTRNKGMTDLDIVFASCSYGAVQVDGDWRYRVILGTVDDAGDAMKLADAGESIAGFTLNPKHLRTLLETLSTFAEQGGDEAQQFAMLVEQMDEFGVFGDDAPSVTWTTERRADGALLSRTTVKNLGKITDKMGAPRASINGDHLSVVPADATVVSISSLDLSSIHDSIEQMDAQGVPASSMLEEFTDNTGIDPLAIADSIGGTAIYYTADSTGGGGVFSSVMLMELQDAEEFRSNMSRLSEVGNDFASQIPEMGHRVRVVEREVGDSHVTSIRFPGLPVPVELAFATTDRWLVAGLSPQGVKEASELAARADSRLVSMDDLRALAPDADGFASVSGVDPVRMLRSGYPIMQMIGTMIGNLATVPNDVESGEDVVPAFNELMADPGLFITIDYWSGDDFVTDSLSSGSVVVTSTISAGVVMHYMPVILPIVGGISAAASQAGQQWGMLPPEQHAAWIGAAISAVEGRALGR